MSDVLGVQGWALDVGDQRPFPCRSNGGIVDDRRPPNVGLEAMREVVTMRNLGRSVVAASAVLAGVMVLPTPASADTGATGRDFGHHVVTCAQTMGFNGDHDPGMHQGFAGWDPMHMC